MYKFLTTIIAAGMAIASTSCGHAKSEQNSAISKADTSVMTDIPDFDADSAYAFIDAQVAFGPRVPGTPAHEKCENYIVSSLQKFGADTVSVQRTTVTAFDGTRLPVANIMASFNNGAPRKVLLVAHYDTRPFADEEKEKSKRNTPIDGANDGGSGVGVLLEIARQLGQKAPQIGIDILFTDVEDYGTSEGQDSDGSWCLGTQYWADNNPYVGKTRPAYGILLDMVGGRGAVFTREYTSMSLAPDIVNLVWGTASRSPYSDRFSNDVQGAAMDDHIYVSKAGIPCIDIIEIANPQTGGFPPTWHTLADNMDAIDRSTLKAVGQVVTDVLYSEPATQP